MVMPSTSATGKRHLTTSRLTNSIDGRLISPNGPISRLLSSPTVFAVYSAHKSQKSFIFTTQRST